MDIHYHNENQRDLSIFIRSQLQILRFDDSLFKFKEQ